MHLWDLIELHRDGPNPQFPIEVLRIPNGDPLPETNNEALFWVRTFIAKSRDEIDFYYNQILRRKC